MNAEKETQILKEIKPKNQKLKKVLKRKKKLLRKDLNSTLVGSRKF